jgi:hypothetical protein
MKEHVSQQLYAYWNSVRGDRMAPKRFEIEPSQISAILPDTFILEAIDSGTARFRLAGTRICEAFAAEFRGENFFELFPVIDRAELKAQVTTIATQGAVGVFTIEGSTADGKTAIFEIILTPLIHTREQADRFLGAISPLDRPDWLGHEAIITKRLKHTELIWPEGRPHVVVEAMSRQSPFLPHIRNARIVRVDRRQFRVYDGGLHKSNNDG